jgi:transcriptional regulator with XRE-family HTH domain
MRGIDSTRTVGSGDMLGERLRTAREAAQLSPDELAATTGITADRVRDIEHGGSLGASELERIAAAVGRDVHSLLFDGEVREFLLRAGGADRPAVDDAVGILSRFVRDYEFLLSLDA